MALLLVVGVGAYQASAALTLDALTITSSAALTMNGAAGSATTVGSASGASTLALNSGTTGLTTATGDLLINPVRRSAVTADTNLVNIDASTTLTGTTGRTFVLNVTATRPDGNRFTGGGDDAGLKVSVTNKNITSQDNYVLRGLNVGATNRLGGSLGTLQGGLISVTQKGDADSPVVTELTGLQVTMEQDSPNTTIPTNMYGLKVRYDAVMAAPTNSAGIYVYNDSDTALTDPTAALWVGNSAADRQWKYGLKIGSNSVSVADIILQNGETISNSTDGTIAFGTANLTNTGNITVTSGYVNSPSYQVGAGATITTTGTPTKASFQQASYWPVTTAGGAVQVSLIAMDQVDVGRHLVFSMIGGTAALTVVSGVGMTVYQVPAVAAKTVADVTGDAIDCLITTTATAFCTTYATD